MPPSGLALAPRPLRPSVRGSARGLAFALLALAAAFAVPLYRLGRFAFSSGLYSHILLIPLLSAYFARQAGLPAARPTPRGRALAGALALAAGLLATASLLAFPGAASSGEDRLAVSTAAFLLALAAVLAWFRGAAFLRAQSFALGLLVFLIPIPTATMAGIEAVMQHGSAAVARVLFNLAGTPVFYQQLNFQLPGIQLFVAPECSGLRSTLVLVILSAVTAHSFLRSPLARILLVAAVLPLALLRNGFRIFTIGELCVHYGPQMIDSFLHRRGGPIFFGLSLVPFFLLAVFLRRRERVLPG